LVTFNKYYCKDQSKEGEIGGPCSKRGRDQKSIYNFGEIRDSLDDLDEVLYEHNII
jgi:hypothetical protein